MTDSSLSEIEYDQSSHNHKNFEMPKRMTLSEKSIRNEMSVDKVSCIKKSVGTINRQQPRHKPWGIRDNRNKKRSSVIRSDLLNFKRFI